LNVENPYNCPTSKKLPLGHFLSTFYLVSLQDTIHKIDQKHPIFALFITPSFSTIVYN